MSSMLYPALHQQRGKKIDENTADALILGAGKIKSHLDEVIGN